MLFVTEDVFGNLDAMVVDPKGYGSIVSYLADQTFDDKDPRLLLSETVREVLVGADPDPDPDDASASKRSANESERICVRTAAGHEYRAQYCIITFSVRSLNCAFSQRSSDLEQCV